MYQEKFFPESKFGGFTDLDGTVAFFSRLNSLLLPSFTILDVGCGRGAYGEDPCSYRRNLRILKGKVAKVMGIDVDRIGYENPFLDEFRLIEGDWPVEDDSVDMVVSDCVLEHIEDINQYFAEARRVIKPNGYFCIRTSNQWSYLALFSKLIPNKHHSKVLKVVQEGRKEEDVFPTQYKCNTIRKIKAMMSAYHFDAAVYGYESEPVYFNFSASAYRLGMLHQKMAPHFIKPAIFAFGKKIA